MPPFPPRPLLLLLALLPFCAAAAPTYKNSWVKIEPPADSRTYDEGDPFDIVVDYHLDPDDVEGGETRLVVAPVGPYLGPDNKPVHQSYPGLERRRVPVAPGSGRRTFTFEAPPLFKRNELHFVAHFENADGQRWPLVWSYDARTDEPLKPRIRLAPRPAFYSLSTERPANLFTYDEPVRLRVAFHPGAAAGERRLLRYRVHDAYGNTGAGGLPFVSKSPGETTDLVLPLERRGVFALEAEIDDWGARELVFARIPDLAAILGDHVTPFGATELQTEAENAIARRLGFSHARHHQFHWAKAQPAPDRWELEVWDRIIETNLRHRIHPHITVWRPPLWIMPDGLFGGAHSYQPFPFDRDAWRRSARHLASRWGDKIAGFEWLNEIVAGSASADPVADYLDFCRIGSEAVREVAPRLHLQLAGGIHPRNFRQLVLRSGAARHVDAVPVHYGDESSVRDARDDLASVGLPDLPVWDNETARALWVWDREWREIVRDRTQPEWVLTRFPGQLAAGAGRIFYFGGWSGGAAGGWNYLMDGETPLPVAVTLAVQAAKLGRATPVGSFHLGALGRAHVFETDGRIVAVAHTRRAEGETVALPMSGGPLVLTDYQGNETRLPVEAGHAALRLESMPVFIEGGDPDAWRALASLRIGDGAARPRLVRPRGATASLPVHLSGSFADTRLVTLSVETPPDWPPIPPRELRLEPGRHVRAEIPLAIPASAPPGARTLRVSAAFSGLAHPVLHEVALAVIDPAQLGNQLRNPAFDAPGSSPLKARHWSGSAQARRAPVADDPTPGLGSHVVALDGIADTWGYIGQTIPVLPGQSYLYSVWVRTDDVTAGSNVSYRLDDGRTVTRHINQVFTAPSRGPWRHLSARLDPPPGAVSLAVEPIAHGPGSAAFANARLAFHQDTAWTSEARRAARPPVMDGRLDDWDLREPLPLLADNQLGARAPGYAWTPANLSAAAWLAWHETGLLLAVRVRDDVHRPLGDEARLAEGDGLLLAIHPADRAPGADDRAFALVVNAAPPAAGGGRHIVYRPREYSGGLAFGHLARDSSVYDVAVAREGEFTTYELLIPWSELGGLRPAAGERLGLSLRLNDNDGSGLAASMDWGEGLPPDWAPARFGAVTLAD